jgi:hypothetical protein
MRTEHSDIPRHRARHRGQRLAAHGEVLNSTPFGVNLVVGDLVLKRSSANHLLQTGSFRGGLWVLIRQ